MDIPTLYLTIVLVSAILAMMVGWVAQNGPRDGLWLWAVGLVTQTLAYVLLSLRGEIADWSSIVLANVLLSSSLALYGESLHQFYARRPRRWVMWLPVGLTFVAFSVLMDNMAARLLAGPVIFGLQVLIMLALLLVKRRITVGRGQYLVLLGLVSLLAVLVFRAVGCCGGTVLLAPLAVPTVYHSLTFMVVLADTLLTTFGFVLMNKERVDFRNRQLAMFDELTGVPNRRHALQALARQVAVAQRGGQALTVLMLDLDNFKRVNDLYGHRTGDAALRHVAQTLQSRLRHQDLLGRVGGEEFLGLLPATAAAGGGLRLAEALRAVVAANPMEAGHEPGIALSVSVGVAEVPPGGSFSAEAVYGAADRALYRAKESGRNRVELAQAQDYACAPPLQPPPTQRTRMPGTAPGQGSST